MPWRKVYDQLQELTGTKGVKAKKDRVKYFVERDDPKGLLLKVIKYALDQDRQYFVSRVCQYKDSALSIGEGSPTTVFNVLDGLNDKRSANDHDKAILNQWGFHNPDLGFILDRIVRKDLRCGLKAKSINQILGPWTVFDVPYQQCSREDKIKNIRYPATVELKADGLFAYGFVTTNDRTGQPFLTRNGSGFNLLGVLEPQIQNINKIWMNECMPEGGSTSVVTVGEMVLLDENGELMNRQTSNGLMDKFIECTADQALAERVTYSLWTIIPVVDWYNGKCDLSQVARKNSLVHMLTMADNIPNLRLLECDDHVQDEAQARAFYKRMRFKKLEGAILKDHEGKWLYNRAADQIKLKNVSEAEFRIVEAYYGDAGGKYEHVLGGITVESEEGKIRTNVGSGFKDFHRERGVDWWNDRAGGIVTCKFTGFLEDKTDRETIALENPRFIEDRFKEKTVADTYEYCLEQID